MKKRKEGNLLVFDTDKSGKLSVDTVENFANKMQPHIKGEEVEKDQVQEIVKETNIRARVWSRIMSTGANWNHEDRVKSAVTTYSTDPPVLYGLRKDHKTVNDGDEQRKSSKWRKTSI